MKHLISNNSLFAVCLGYGIVLACAPTTSAIEVAFSVDVFKMGSAGWWDQVVFVLFFVVGMVYLATNSERAPSVLEARGVLVRAFAITELGVLVLASVLLLDPASEATRYLLVASAMLRGVGMAALQIAYIEVMVKTTSQVRRMVPLLPLSLILSSLVAIGMWLLTLLPGAVPAVLALALCILASFALLLRAKGDEARAGAVPGGKVRRLEMPPLTRVIIGAFGLAMGCSWAVLYSIEGVDLPMFSCLGFLALSLVLAAGTRLLGTERGLRFGVVLRLTLLVSVGALLLLPVLLPVNPAAAVFALAFAWAVQILLLTLMPVQMAGQLPVSVLSVASAGGAPFGAGAILGSLFAGACFAAFSSEAYAYAVIVAVTCFALALSAMLFPARNLNASALGIRVQLEDETPAQRLERCCKTVGEKAGLTPREQEVMLLLAKGMSRARIAQELTVSEETVRTHAKHVYEKLQVHSLREMVTYIEGFDQ